MKWMTDNEFYIWMNYFNQSLSLYRLIDWLKEYSLDEHQKIIFIKFLANNYRGTRFYFEHYGKISLPGAVQTIIDIVDRWEDAWVHVITQYSIPYLGSKSYLQSLGAIVA